MTRLRATLIAALLLIVTSSAAAGQSPSPSVSPTPSPTSPDWRPLAPDRLALLDASLAPYLADFVPAFDAGIGEIGVITAYLPFSSPAAMVKDLIARRTAVDRLSGDLDVMMDVAVGVLAGLDATPTEPCMDDYRAVMRTGALILGDSVQAVRTGIFADEHLNAAKFLLIDYGELVHGLAETECAA